jgi:DNA-binding transcriptional ArsR family regulator
VARILLGVSGGIAAYKAVELVRLAVKAGHAVRVVQTRDSLEFVGRATFEGITGAPVLVEEFERDPARGAFPGDPAPGHDPISHLELVSRADVFCVAPASANTLAKLAHGLADNLLTSAALAEPTRARIILILAESERMVGELVQLLDVPQSTVSRHLAVLRASNLVSARREANCVFYRLSSSHIGDMVREAFSHAEHERLNLLDHDAHDQAAQAL